MKLSKLLSSTIASRRRSKSEVGNGKKITKTSKSMTNKRTSSTLPLNHQHAQHEEEEKRRHSMHCLSQLSPKSTSRLSLYPRLKSSLLEDAVNQIDLDENRFYETETIASKTKNQGNQEGHIQSKITHRLGHHQQEQKQSPCRCSSSSESIAAAKATALAPKLHPKTPEIATSSTNHGSKIKKRNVKFRNHADYESATIPNFIITRTIDNASSSSAEVSCSSSDDGDKKPAAKPFFVPKCSHQQQKGNPYQRRAVSFISADNYSGRIEGKKNNVGNQYYIKAKRPPPPPSASLRTFKSTTCVPASSSSVPDCCSSFKERVFQDYQDLRNGHDDGSVTPAYASLPSTSSATAAAAVAVAPITAGNDDSIHFAAVNHRRSNALTSLYTSLTQELRSIPDIDDDQVLSPFNSQSNVASSSLSSLQDTAHIVDATSLCSSRTILDYQVSVSS